MAKLLTGRRSSIIQTMTTFWQSRSLPWEIHENVSPAVLNVGGWFDAETRWGPFISTAQ